MKLKTSGFVRAMRNESFRTLWIGQLISQVGDSFAILAGLVTINSLTSSTLALGIMVVAITLPQLAFGLIAGVFVDRFDRKTTMIASDIVRGLAILVLLTVDSPDQLYRFYIVGFLVSMGGLFFNPARNATLPNIVDDDMLLTANALSQSSQVAATVFGPAVAGLAIGIFGTHPAFIFDSATFFVSAVFIAMVVIPGGNSNHEKTSTGVLFRQLREGLTFIKDHSAILHVMLTGAVAMLGVGAVTVLGVRYLDEVLGVGATGLGFLNSIQGVGMVAGGVVIGNFAPQEQSHHIVSVGMIVLGLALSSFAFGPNFTVVLVAAFVIGFCLVSARSTLAAMTQAIVPDEKRGRVESAVTTLISLATALSMGLAGLLGDPLGVRTVFLLAGMVTVAAGISAAFTFQHSWTVKASQSEVH